ncbi:Helix-turn-helix domain-containing protein [Lishizhenia tianjinensis]|uniref:Helix-turn-helix domain-containing protein n=1 Tax=Lishizhenia tianjinensis TaxID=477690 RepID=A0A1I6YC22_9FLAO|nr:helix-turn-helix domain-containing protein [Lishizhenia tianjinensis]SFT47764.1 Helix-turn-helix domain-containing protein [Lishizhenia tianjinensis]
MAATIITLEDLTQFKQEIIEEMRALVAHQSFLPVEEPEPKKEEKKLIKSHQVQRLLGISPGTLQTLRNNGTIPYSKIGGILFYDKAEIMNLIESNKRNV